MVFIAGAQKNTHKGGAERERETRALQKWAWKMMEVKKTQRDGD